MSEALMTEAFRQALRDILLRCAGCAYVAAADLHHLQYEVREALLELEWLYRTADQMNRGTEAEVRVAYRGKRDEILTALRVLKVIGPSLYDAYDDLRAAMDRLCGIE